MNIILYLLQIINDLYSQNAWMVQFLCKYIPLKQWAYDDTHSPKYQKFKTDELPKLVYQEQLKVLAKISGMVQAATEEKLKPDKHMQAYQKLEELVKKYHPNSHGQKWTREELYER